jgi:NAD dependent epimerase/dehydratase family
MIPAFSNGLVLVTGGSGYIAGFCVAQLLQDGWRVRTTVRSLAKAQQVRSSIAKISAAAETIEFFEADLNSDLAWDRAVAGAGYVLHVASPLPEVAPKSDDELVRPARDGALRVLKAARDAGVKRVVMTSSVAAIAHGRGAHPGAFTESDWTDEKNLADTTPDVAPDFHPVAARVWRLLASYTDVATGQGAEPLRSAASWPRGGEKLAGVDSWRQPADTGMRPNLIIVAAPFFERLAGLHQ